VRLHTMTVTAFGPYPGTSRIDFDELSGAGLFLLHGATGAGKTSVLDAVCYALYGGVPGARHGMRLRSDHAQPDVPTAVVLELTVGGRRLEVTRRPEQPRPKRRGSGTTMDKAVTLLREQVPGDGEWKALSRSHQEVGEELRQLLGMSREQFCQVVLLPQGDFARFLRSDAGERAELLGRLFDTGRFEAVEQWLAERRRAAEARVRGEDEGLIALAHRMGQAAGPAAAEQPLPAMTAGEPRLAQEVLQWAAFARSTAREHRDVAALALTAAEADHRAAERTLEQATETARLQQRYRLALRRAAELDAWQAEFERSQALLDRAHAADRVAPALRAHAAAVQEHERAGRRGREAAAPLPERLAGASAARLTEEERAVRQDLGRLDAARRAERRAAAIVAERAGLEREAAADEDLERETGAWLASWDERRDTYRRRLEAAQEAATTAERLAGRLEQARRRLEAARRRDALAVDEQRSAEGLLAARDAAAGAREHWLDVKERRLRGIAAELAEGLAPGAPCPVCGSAEHPEPSRPGERHADRAAEQSAHEEYQRAEEVRARRDTESHTVRERLAAALADAGESTADQLRTEAEELERESGRARGTAADALPAGEELRRAEKEHDRRLDLLRDTQRRTAARVSTREALDRELAALQEELTEAGGTQDGGVAERATRLEQLAALLAAAADAAREADATAQRRTETGELLQQACAQAGFDTPALAEEALLGEPERRELRQRIETHRARLTAVEAELADATVAGAAGLPAADPDAHRAVLETATRALRAASAADTAARERCAELDRLSAGAVRQTTALAPLREEHGRLRRLAQLTAGTSADNELRMRLESYVLAARLEQVAAAAGVRLRRMSSGRYTLVHTDAKASGRTRSGLGLRVVDAWTGTERDTATLSGGETFFASLALALGLADVVTDEAGAVRLDTLFIDEGFGSLDDQTLDEVLDVLDSLRERDRTVGIVSHVADLRHRIPTQLEVVKGRGGSFVRHRTGAASR
jgi:DNA repair protein SbcC/Rad50